MADQNPATAEAKADADAYQHGSMTINEQVATWSLVQGLLKWGSLGIAAVLVFLVLAFQHGGSFIGGLGAGIVLFAVGFVFLRSGSKAH